MAAVARENYVLHKIHSLTGIVPVGYYMAQHLTLNSFTLVGPQRFDGVIEFFEAIPKPFLLALEVTAIWLPLLFHAVYGMFIISRSKENYFTRKFNWSQNRMYTFQRYSGVFLTFFLLFHTVTTTGAKYAADAAGRDGAALIKYAAWQAKFLDAGVFGYLLFAFYVLGVLTASYHLAYGIWNFCIRWGITISERAQNQVQKFSMGVFVALTLLGWGALVGFLIHKAPAPEALKPSPARSVAYETAR